MESPLRESPADRGELWWPSLVAVALFVLLLLGAYAAGLVLPVGDLAGPDSYMWLYLVETAHHGGDSLGYLFDGMHSPRSNAPHGETLHWTWPFFTLLYVPAWLGSQLTGGPFGDALFVWGVLIGPLLLGATVLTMVWGLDPLLRRGERFVVTLFLLMNAGMVLGFQVARPDHQALCLFLIALALALGVRAMIGLVWMKAAMGWVTGENRSFVQGWVLGLIVVLSVWVSAEGLIILLILQKSCLLGRLMRLHQDFDALAAGIAFSAFFVWGAIGVFLSLGGGLGSQTDVLGGYHVLLALGFVFFWGGWVFRQDSRQGADALFASFVLQLWGAGMIAWALCYLIHPYSTMDERVREVWQSGVVESRPLWHSLHTLPGFVVLVLGPVVAGLLATLWRWLVCPAGERQQRPAWMLLATGIGAYAVVSLFLQQRFFVQANLLAAGPFAVLVWRGLHLADRPMPLLRAMVAGSVFALLGGVLIWGQTAWERDGHSPVAESTKSKDAAPPPPAAGKPLASLAALTHWMHRQRQEPATILAFLNLGPELLYRTPHRVVSTPYHRNNTGILDDFAFFSSPPDEYPKAERLARQRGVDWVLVRPGHPEELAYYTQLSGQKSPVLWSELAAGRPPAWLVEVPLPPELARSFRLYRVRVPNFPTFPADTRRGLRQPSPPMSYRTGIGYDVHQLVEGRDLYLGGVQIPHDKGLDGHSDADALLHAVADAILGAIGEGDIGQHFPNTDPQWKGVRSTVLLEVIAQKLADRGARLENIDAMLIAEEPKVGPHIADMKAATATALGITPGQVGIKATTNETMGFVGRREGIAAMAVASVELP